MEPFLAAAVQATPVFLDLDATVDRVVDLVGEAAGRHARLVVFPETFVPGFPYWPRANPQPDRHKSFTALAQLSENALVLDSPAEQRIAAAAREHSVFVVVGVTEKDEAMSGTLFNTLLYYDDKGARIGHHRKLVPTFDEACVWGRGDGSHLKVYDTDVGRISGLICGNNRMPLAKAALQMAGEQIHVAVWPGYTDPEKLSLTCRAHAQDAGVYVIVSSSYLTADDIPADFVLRDETVWNVAGCSGIINPRGEWIAGPVVGAEEIVIGEIDLSTIVAARGLGDVTGVYSRPDILRLSVQVSPQYQRGGPHTDEEWQVFA